MQHVAAAERDLEEGAGAGNFEWAIETLRELDAKRPNVPRSQADLAEARTWRARGGPRSGGA